MTLLPAAEGRVTSGEWPCYQQRMVVLPLQSRWLLLAVQQVAMLKIA
jgi:hypothetical protein